LRKAGWDTHGLPVEIEVEKKLGLKNKKDIENFGISKFNKECKESVWEYKKDWEKLTERIGYWIDLKNPYITYEPGYIETLWFILKKIWEKGLLYQDFKVVPYCPRCGTSLSSHEVAQGYKRIKEPAIYIKFKILNPEFKNTSLLVWTTTPWTLPGNVAVAVNPKFIYAKVKIEGEYLILAKERLNILGKDCEIVKEFKGNDLVGLRYEALYPKEEALKSAYQVLPADFVSLEEGTGLVHIAPAFGEDDMELIKNQNVKIKNQNEKFPILVTVDEEGKFKLDVKKWARIFFKDADPLIIEDLKQRGLLFKEELYEHDYPFCWRCKTPLLYYTKKSWFIKMTKMKRDLIKNNQEINWIPSYIKEGRFGEWLKEVKDWALSRERYWGTPLPIWQCQMEKSQISNSKLQIPNSQKCNNIVVIGSLKDLLSQKFSTNNYYLFRHGYSLRQVKNLAMCWPEKIFCPLTKEGEKEVVLSAQKLKNKKIDLIFSSDLLRTKQTAQIISEITGAKIIFDKRLREYNVGIFNGKEAKLVWDYLAKRKDIISTKLPKGESIREVAKRMYNFMKEINEEYQNKNIVIVSHEFPLTILEGTLKGIPLKEILELRKRKKIKRIETGEFRKVKFCNLPFNEKMELDFHKPYIDKVKFYCPKCGGIMERVPEVIDCWFDSGSMPFAQYHWPFENGKEPKLFPADYISEGIDQTRGWFYTLLAVSTLLGLGPSYKNVISLGHVLDENGEKMSKSKGNVVDPWYIVEKYGADAIRWYFYTVNQPGDSKLFSEKDVEESLRKFVFTLWNCFTFYDTYKEKVKSQKSKVKSQHILDRWVISKLNNLIKEVTQRLDKYDVTGAARAIENFIIGDLSLWYIRRSRRRFQRPENKKELQEASVTLNYVLLTLSKLTAPFIPFLSEEIYQKIFNFGASADRSEREEEVPLFALQFSIFKSVHLEDWPKANKKLIDKKLEEKMARVREIVVLALAERAKLGIKVRQPLNNLQLTTDNLQRERELLDLIKEEVNVKNISFGKNFQLDTKITPQLKEEGIVREVIRHIQEMRKKIGLKPKDKIFGFYFGPQNLNEILFKNREKIMKEGKIESFKIKEKGKFDFEKEIKVEKENLWLAIKKI
jgi:isoleucyl-tRNA synthetase